MTRSSWNKGLRKETDKRVAENARKISKKLKSLFSEGILVPWNTGLSDPKRGKTYNKFYGEERANGIKEKQSLSHKGKIPFNIGKSYEEVYGRNKAKGIKKKISFSHKGIESEKKGKTYEEMYGSERANTIKKIMSKQRKEKPAKSIFKKGHKWSNKKLKQILKACNSKPNGKEAKLIKLFREFKLPYKFVGDGSFTIDSKCPDFINYNGQKKIIELFGDYWHSKEITGRTKFEEENRRKKAFAKYGFKTLILWESELENTTDLIGRVKGFENE